MELPWSRFAAAAPSYALQKSIVLVAVLIAFAAQHDKSRLLPVNQHYKLHLSFCKKFVMQFVLGTVL